MRLIAEYDRTSYDADGTAILSLKVPRHQHKQLLAELDQSAPLAVEITKYKSKRSIEQNRYMWALLSEIDKARNGSRSSAEWDVYIEALERAGAKYEYIACLTAAEDMLRKSFRAIQYVKPFEGGKGEMGVYKCYYGSSKMTTAEMSELIETILDMAAEAGIDTACWEGVLI
nr:MAG TPA: NinB protein [Caudoviricetes sp.]